MDIKEIKEYILSNEKTIYILENLGMHSINDNHGKFISCGMPDGDNPNSTIIYKDISLTVMAYTRKLPHKEENKPNIFNLIMFIKNISFSESIKWCTSLLGLSNTYNSKNNQRDDYGKLREIVQNSKKYTGGYTQGEQVFYSKEILKNFHDVVHIDLIKNDGLIDYEILKKYHVMFDERTNRIVFPHLKYDDANKIAGIVGRTTIKAYKELKISKYMSLLDTEYIKTNNLYGLSLNIEEIKKRGQIIIFEAEKSVMKADMFRFPIGVAVGCHDISDFQVKLLLSLDVEIIIAFDKDVSEEDLKKVCNKFKFFRKTSYIYDKWGLLKEKSSPVDEGIKKWNFLFKNRVFV